MWCSQCRFHDRRAHLLPARNRFVRASDLLATYLQTGSRGSPERDNASHPKIEYAALRQQSILIDMQRLFSMFPEGWPGIGLLFLRSSVAIALLAEACCQRQSLGWTSWAAILLSFPLFAGYMTPIAATIGLLLQGMCWSGFGGGSATFAIIISLDIAALALLGPGAYSVDALRFGRRVLVLPPSNERAGASRQTNIAS